MTHRTIWILLALGALLVSPWWPGATAEASNDLCETLEPEIQCTHCHDKPGSRLLTDEGKYFEVMRSFDGLDEVNATFGSCTSCHVKKPGSLKLTTNGKRFAKLVGDMQGLKSLLKAEHPMPSDEPPEGDEVSPEN